MAKGRFISYLRVSTREQGASGLGIEAQRKAVLDYLDGGRWSLVGEFVEIESGARNDRPELAKAFAACRVHKATLVISRLDRLSRNAHFLLGLEAAGIDFIAADMPTANRLTIHVMAAVAEEERRAIGIRTKAALAAAKARGVRLGGWRGKPGSVPGAAMQEASSAALKAKAQGFAMDLAPVVADIRARGITSASGIARLLTERQIPTARGSSAWTPTAVRRVLDLIERAARQEEGGG
jgi:DNA invertase Pin-like site-specific DNA recombinase